ncbi:MAG: deoxyribodipyrimidine photo-lyase [Bacteroidetes bacterium]|nr:deoxyribodipyrimidine photo-lyase [Bacteroidota bacterium]MDA0903132.1 deoxyribodipyrimidine photo-lyase [Bacteroidota bacterium]MDA1242379.1 deoxyribodipyrimidine photo-lyase [Bacteroidota bacterium]
MNFEDAAMTLPPSLCSGPIAIHWFRRDLRWQDNRALHAALQSDLPVVPIFIFDRHILERLEGPEDRRVQFLHDRLDQLRLHVQGWSDVWVVHSTPEEVMTALAEQADVKAVYANEDYEPYAVKRDHKVANFWEERGVPFHRFKDHVIKAPGEVLKPDGTPYTVFTPFSRRWQAEVRADDVAPAPSEHHLGNLHRFSAPPTPALTDLGFSAIKVSFPDPHIDAKVLASYAERRDLPAISGTSRISVHLRFGTLSVREAYAQGIKHSDKWVTELVWREFYQAIMAAFPHSMESAFKPAYDRVPWRHDGEQFEAWKEGQTGYPLVDAGMRELKHTGFMHNRVRMVVASFLCKHLLLDWRLGERHFAAQLLDFELASNVGGWQWAAGTGCDAAPYFRVFNPTSQWTKFDPKSDYVRRWVPEFESLSYARPIVDHAFARQRAIDTYKQALTSE